VEVGSHVLLKFVMIEMVGPFEGATPDAFPFIPLNWGTIIGRETLLWL
jgi:hypothetical protein